MLPFLKVKNRRSYVAFVREHCCACCGCDGCWLRQRKKGKSGNVSVVFAQKESSNLLDATEGQVAGADLTTLKIKPIAVGLSAELNSNKYMIWGSKNCPGKDHKVKIDGKYYHYSVYEGGVCKANADDDYLDMLDIDALNETLNSQSYPVPPGTYKYVSLVFCSENQKGEGVESVAYRAPEMPEDHAIEHCDPATGYSEVGVTIPEGGAVKVQLTYDLDKLVDSLKHSSDMPAHEPGPFDNGCYWTPDGMTQYCPKFGQGALVPSMVE